MQALKAKISTTNAQKGEPPLPPYPEEWDCLITDRKTGSISLKLNSIFSLTALGVYTATLLSSPTVSQQLH
jgi:hypothetical protein